MSDQTAGEDTGAGDDDAQDNGARWYMPRCKVLRESAGMRKQTLANEAKVDRATIDKLEKLHPVTRPTAFRVFNALKTHHVTKLDPEKEITDTLRKRR